VAPLVRNPQTSYVRVKIHQLEKHLQMQVGLSPIYGILESVELQYQYTQQCHSLGQVSTLSKALKDDLAHGFELVIGPIVGGFIAQSRLGWRFNFWVIIIFASTSLFLGYLITPETVTAVSESLVSYPSDTICSMLLSSYGDVP
jgi:hypothetical protein